MKRKVCVIPEQHFCTGSYYINSSSCSRDSAIHQRADQGRGLFPPSPSYYHPPSSTSELFQHLRQLFPTLALAHHRHSCSQPTMPPAHPLRIRKPPTSKPQPRLCPDILCCCCHKRLNEANGWYTVVCRCGHSRCGRCRQME